MKHFLLLFLAAFVVFSCEKAELPKPLSATGGNDNTVSVTMGATYENQLYFNLAQRKVVKTVPKDNWDLGFSNDAGSDRIVLNSAKMMAVFKTAVTELAQVTSLSGATWQYDSPSGRYDSLALKDWELNRVYLLDRGMNAAGTQIGKIKFRITAMNATSFSIEWAKVSATSGFSTATFTKGTGTNFTHVSLAGAGSIIDVEPLQQDWDLCFTSYTHIFEDGTPYLVTGVLSNSTIVRVAQVTTEFDAIDLAYASGLSYTEDLNVIGYDWKTYDFNAELYVVDFKKHYVVHAVDGSYYKLRFLDFYDANGLKGTPSFELVKL